MQFSDPISKQGAVEQIRFLVGANEQQYNNNDIARNFNLAMNEYYSLVLKGNSEWAFEPYTNTDLSIATTTLVSGQQDYSFPNEILEIHRMEVLNQATGGDYFKIHAIDQREINVAMDEFLESDSIPTYYDKIGNTFLLYPTPNYTAVDGIQIYYSRKHTDFTPADTTRELGIPAVHNPYIIYKTAYPYAVAKSTNNVGFLQREIEKMEATIPNYFTRRSKDKKQVLMPRYHSAR